MDFKETGFEIMHYTHQAEDGVHSSEDVLNMQVARQARNYLTKRLLPSQEK
jgi:hypothetical protein